MPCGCCCSRAGGTSKSSLDADTSLHALHTKLRQDIQKTKSELGKDNRVLPSRKVYNLNLEEDAADGKTEVQPGLIKKLSLEFVTFKNITVSSQLLQAFKPMRLMNWSEGVATFTDVTITAKGDDFQCIKAPVIKFGKIKNGLQFYKKFSSFRSKKKQSLWLINIDFAFAAFNAFSNLSVLKLHEKFELKFDYSSMVKLVRCVNNAPSVTVFEWVTSYATGSILGGTLSVDPPNPGTQRQFYLEFDSLLGSKDIFHVEGRKGLLFKLVFDVGIVQHKEFIGRLKNKDYSMNVSYPMQYSLGRSSFEYQRYLDFPQLKVDLFSYYTP